MIKNLYSDDQHLEFSALFSHPGARYRDAPFWAWNCKLDGEELIRQIGVFRQMGMGGFHIHARTGLETPYLGPEFLKQVRRCVAEAKDHAMYCYLYDEDRWPSGSAGGQVTRNPAFRMRYLLVTPHRLSLIHIWKRYRPGSDSSSAYSRFCRYGNERRSLLQQRQLQ